MSDKEKEDFRQKELRREYDNERAERILMYKATWWPDCFENPIGTIKSEEKNEKFEIVMTDERTDTVKTYDEYLKELSDGNHKSIPGSPKTENIVSPKNPYRNIVRKHLEELWLLSYYKELLPNPNADFIEDTRMIALIIDGEDHVKNLGRDLKQQEEMEKFAWIVLRINESEIKRVKIDKEEMYARYKINRNIKPEESNYWEILRALCHIHIGVRYNSKWYSWVDVPTGNELRYLYPWNKRRAFPGINVNTENKTRNFIYPSNAKLEAYELEQPDILREVLETEYEAPELWSGTVSTSKKDDTDMFEF